MVLVLPIYLGSVIIVNTFRVLQFCSIISPVNFVCCWGFQFKSIILHGFILKSKSEKNVEPGKGASQFIENKGHLSRKINKTSSGKNSSKRWHSTCFLWDFEFRGLWNLGNFCHLIMDHPSWSEIKCILCRHEDIV